MTEVAVKGKEGKKRENEKRKSATQMQIVLQIYKSFTQVKVTLCMFIHHSPSDSTGWMRMFKFVSISWWYARLSFCAYVISEYYFVVLFFSFFFCVWKWILCSQTIKFFWLRSLACCFTEINIFIHSITGLSSCNFGFRDFYCRLSKRQTHVHKDSDVVRLIADMKNKNG